ncbi:MAG: NifB/NifX family molybdenum-iron cluster-binding protein [Desulfobacteraceae bacterium]|nr:NifB/NifX family molybdenum-iron cluster-binding protein [Desulfobacteraceae bacterium]
MKIAVSATGQTLYNALDPGFGRCAGFVVYDANTGTTAFLDNSQQQNEAQGAGIQTARMISGAGVDVLISGRIGPKALQALSQSRIRLFSSSADTVQAAIDAFQRNELTPISTAAGQPGAGRGVGGGGGARGRGPGQGGQGLGGGARGKGPGQGGRGRGGGNQGGTF